MLTEPTWYEPFVVPEERHLVDVPNVFGSRWEFCKVPCPPPHRPLKDTSHASRISPLDS